MDAFEAFDVDLIDGEAICLTTLQDFAEGPMIILGGMLACIIYGILHDQVTARVCIQYFTVWHGRPCLRSSIVERMDKSATLTALYWGVVATWWMGLFMGIPVAFAARFGPPPKVSSIQLFPLVGILCAFTMASAMLTLCVSLAVRYVRHKQGKCRCATISAITKTKTECKFRVDAVGDAHTVSYGLGGLCGFALFIYVIVWRATH